MFRMLCLFYFVGILILLIIPLSSENESESRCSASVLKIGVISDNSSRVGNEQKIAIQIVVQDFHLSSCIKVELLLVDSPSNSAQATSTALDLISNKKVKVMLGTLTREEISLIFELNKASINIPIISLSLASLVPTSTSIHMPSFTQMADDITQHMQCLAAIVGTFQWRKVTAIYEDRNDFSTNMAILNILSNSLKDVNSEIENHFAFSLSDLESIIEEKLINLSSKSNRVFIVVQSSIEFATILFEKAKKLNMMENGYAWIVGSEIANLVDSLDSSSFYNMEGVIGCRNYFDETKVSFKKFKTKFRRIYTTEISEDEGKTDPSIYALRAYDAYWAIALAINKLQEKGNLSGKEIKQKVLESKFEGLSGFVSFKNGILSHLPPIFQIINVVGRSYKEIAFWSPESGFYNKLKRNMSTGNGVFDISSLILWPGNGKTIPKGWDFSDKEKPLKIAVPTTAAFQEFVRVNYNHTNGPHISGFSITVFQLVVSNLPYFLPYEFIPFNGSYDSLLQRVYNKEYDGAVGDFGIFADRFKWVDFSEPYLVNEAVMIVREKTLKWTKLWLFMKAFSAEMWLLIFFMHIFVSTVIWVIERRHNDDLKGLGNMFWFSVSVIFFVHREPVKTGLARLVLGPWLFVILIITASFTASLSSMMTISRSKPSFLDIETLKITNATVGCNKNSVMVRFLTQVLNFDPQNVKQIPSVDLFPNALENGEIKAAFFSGPHADVFLAKHCKGYTKATIFKLVGMGFAFPKGSPLTVDMSASIAELIERREIPDLGTTLLSTFNCSSNNKNNAGSGLGPEPFAGLFLISGSIASAAILITVSRLALMNLGWIERPVSTRAHIPK